MIGQVLVLIVMMILSLCSTLTHAPSRQAASQRSVHRHSTPPRRSPRPPVPSRPAVTLDSTAYCETGTMADGQRTHVGAAAADGYAFGTRLLITSGPEAGSVVVIEDRSAPGATDLDIWMPSCAAAIDYGRRVIKVEPY